MIQYAVLIVEHFVQQLNRFHELQEEKLNSQQLTMEKQRRAYFKFHASK